MATSATTIRDGIVAAVEGKTPTTTGPHGSAFHRLDVSDLAAFKGQASTVDDRGFTVHFQGGDAPLSPTSRTEKRVQRRLSIEVLYALDTEEEGFSLDGRIEDDAADIENAIAVYLLTGSSPSDLANVELTDGPPDPYQPGEGAQFLVKTYTVTLDFWRAA